MPKHRTPATPPSNTVTFRPDSRNGYKDYQIPRAVAKDLFERGEIFGDGTNGGYMPNPKSTYNVRQHIVGEDGMRLYRMGRTS